MWPFPKRKQPPAISTPTEATSHITGNPALARARGINYALKAPTGKISKENTISFYDSLARHESRFAGYPTDQARRICKVLRYLAQFDEDVHGAKRILVNLANAGHSLEFVGGVRAVEKATQEIERWALTIYSQGGNLNGLANNQLAELLVSRGSSIEWFPFRNRSGVQGVEILHAEDIEIRRDKDTHRYRYFQNGNQEHNYLLEPVELHPETYAYIAMNNDGNSPYGTPLFIASIEALDRKQNQILPAESRVLNLMKRGAFLLAGVPEPTAQDLGMPVNTPKNDPEYCRKMEEYYNQITDLMLAGQDLAFYLHPSDVEAKITPLAEAASGFPDVIDENLRRVFTGLRTLGMLHGHHDASTESLAKVIYPSLEQESSNMQQVVKTQLEFGINLHLRLAGIAARCYVHFDRPVSPFALEYAQTELTKAQTDQIMMSLLGDAYLPHTARRWDVDIERDGEVGREMRERLELPDPNQTQPNPNQDLTDDDQQVKAVMVYNKQGHKYERGRV